ncbi:MAG: YjbQ family protein, partial [Candidatus Omnitrophica bacterium]|nr:YjbQ family protein [Candidatus Omnitrophota bacterium]
MNALTETLWFNTKTKYAFVNITPQIEELVKKSKVKEGLCLVNAMHITASVFINDDEPGLHHDFSRWLETLAPHA